MQSLMTHAQWIREFDRFTIFCAKMAYNGILRPDMFDHIYYIERIILIE